MNQSSYSSNWLDEICQNPSRKVTSPGVGKEPEFFH